jgi:nitrous oxide reductase accessory protein NosL
MFARYRLVTLWIMSMLISAIITVFAGTAAAAEFLQLPDGSKLDLAKKCPVCGMMIGGKEVRGATVTYKDGKVVGFGGAAAAVFKDGHVVGFEGARCLFIYNSVPEKFKVRVADIARQYVTDYTSKRMIELTKAFLVLGSKVKGPMGYDLIPFANKDEAAKFASENDGKWIVQLHEVNKAAQAQGGKTGALENGSVAGVDQNKEPATAAEPNSVQPQKADGGTRKQALRSRTEGVNRYKPYTDGTGRRDGGHHMMMH